MALLTAEARHCLHPAASPGAHRSPARRAVLWLLLLAGAGAAGFLLRGLF